MEFEIYVFLFEIILDAFFQSITFIIGLWTAASAFYVPGTGLLEAVAVVCLLLAVAGLTQQPANVMGVALIFAAAVLFVVDLKVHSVGLTLVAAVALVLGSVFLFPTGEGRCPAGAVALTLSPWLIAGVTLVSLAFFGVAVSAVGRAQRMAAKVSEAQVVGRRGRATTALDPVGTVQIESELWSARTDKDVAVDAGDEVEVVALDGLKLIVEPLEGSD